MVDEQTTTATEPVAGPAENGNGQAMPAPPAEPSENGADPGEGTAVEKRTPFEPLDFKATGDPMVDFYNGMRARWAVAKVLAKSGIFKHDKPEAIVALMLVAEEMGLHYVTALRTMHVVEGGVGMSADLMLAKMYKAGVRWEFLSDTNEKVEIKFTRGDLAPYTSKFDEHDVKLAGLDKPTRNGKPSNHTRYPRAMKRARCISQAARVVAPDVLANVYTPDEMEAIEAEVIEGTTIVTGPTETPTNMVESILAGAAAGLDDEE